MDSSAIHAGPEPSENRRSRLMEFQANLAQRVQAAGNAAQAPANRLGVLAAGRHWLIDLHEADEIVPVAGITPVPGTRDWYLGLINVRGGLVGVVDLAGFLGQPATVIDKHCRIIAFAPGLCFNCGLLVSSVLGLRALADLQPHASTPESGAILPWMPRTFADAQSRAWTELSLSLLTQDQRFLHVGA